MASGAGQPYVGSLVGTGLKVGVVVARFNDLVTKPLLEGALEAFGRHGVATDDIDVRGPLPPAQFCFRPTPPCFGPATPSSRSPPPLHLVLLSIL